MEGFLQGLHTKEGGGTAVMEFQTIWRSLTKTRLLRELSGDQLKLLFQGIGLVYLNTGQTLMERGAQEECLFVLVSGEINCSFVDRVGNNVDVRSFAPGQTFGEGALFERKPWPAVFKAKGKVTLLKLTPPGLQVCLTGNPDPRGFLDVLRREQSDREVAQAVAKLEGHG
jgi:CRP-like cAMP-binding protein